MGGDSPPGRILHRRSERAPLRDGPVHPARVGTDEILADLGYDTATIAEMRANQVV
nr:hypothetical protein JVH1_8363 [Rhodococcus sp. JVH1]